MENTIKVWNWTNDGKLVIALEVKDMDEARRLATAWNRHNKRWQVAIITNNAVQAHATKITAVC